MPVTYFAAEDVEPLGRQLVAQHHEHLLGQRIDYVYRSEAAKSGGRVVWGKARKITGLGAFLARATTDGERLLDEQGDVEPFFVIEIAYDIWTSLAGRQRFALVDHELCHCKVTIDDDGELKLSLAAHDLEEFEAVVRRNGLWKSDVQHFVKIAADAGEQQSLLDDVEPGEIP